MLRALTHWIIDLFGLRFSYSAPRDLSTFRMGRRRSAHLYVDVQ